MKADGLSETTRKHPSNLVTCILTAPQSQPSGLTGRYVWSSVFLSEVGPSHPINPLYMMVIF